MRPHLSNTNTNRNEMPINNKNKMYHQRLPEDPDAPLLMDTRDMCKRTKRQRGGSKMLIDLYKNNSPLVERIAFGVKLATNECQYQFRDRRWNCTTVRRSIRKVLMRGEY